MKTLFELAGFFQSLANERAEYPTHVELLAQATKHVLQGYADQDDAADAASEAGIRCDVYGNEIESSIVEEAVRFWEDNPGICTEPAFDPWPPKPVTPVTPVKQKTKGKS